MPGLNAGSRRVVSLAFGLWKDKERREGRRIPVDEIVAQTKLSKGTVRSFVAKDHSDVSGASLAAASIIADYFEVPLEKMILKTDEPAA